MEIRKMLEGDYFEVNELWKSCNLELGGSDTEEEIIKFIEKNPETSLVGVKDDRIIASVLGGFDGRRGLVHHLSVEPGFQKQGYGKQLIEELEKRFVEMGVIKISFWVKKNNIGVVEFYEKSGYQLRQDIVTLSKVL